MIDTENKRRSALGEFQPLPAPSGTIADAAKRAMAWIYSGIASSFASIVHTPVEFHVELRRQTFIAVQLRREIPIGVQL